MTATETTVMSDHQISDAYRIAFETWKNGDPEITRYIQSLGYGLGGLHNMLFCFFRAGCLADVAKSRD